LKLVWLLSSLDWQRVCFCLVVGKSTNNLLGEILGPPLVFLGGGKSTNKPPVDFERARWGLHREEFTVCGCAHVSLNLEYNENGSDNLLRSHGSMTDEFSTSAFSSVSMAS
jgi:hypothetical protein